MRGSLTRRTKRSWTIRIDLPIGADGRRRQYTESVKGVKADAQKRLTELLRQQDTGMPIARGKVTVGDWLARWLQEDILPNRRAKTQERYEAVIRLHLAPHIGHLLLTALTPGHVKALLSKLSAAGMAPAGVDLVRTVLHGALKAAMQEEVLARNPVDATSAPRIERAEVIPPDAVAVADILALAEAEGHPLFAALHLLAYSGARRGEVVGLAWEHVDVDRGTITVTRSLGRSKAGLLFEKPKTAAGRRTIDLDGRTIEVLRAHQGRQLLEKLQAEGAYQDQGLVFTTPLGRPINPMSVTRAFQTLAKRCAAGRPRLHALRHFHASVLFGTDQNLFEVSRRLGHASLSTTADIYGHMLPGAGKKQANAFAQAMQQARRQASP